MSFKMYLCTCGEQDFRSQEQTDSASDLSVSAQKSVPFSGVPSRQLCLGLQCRSVSASSSSLRAVWCLDNWVREEVK